MFDFMLPEKHAIAILKKDHDAVKELFDEFEKTEATAAKENIIDQAVAALKIHAVLEEEIFYPTVRTRVGIKVMNEADEEHHVAKVLIAELDRGDNKDHRDAKFTVLAESVRHHIKEEEDKMLPKVKDLGDRFRGPGPADAVPQDAEHAMVAKANGKGDSSAAAAGHAKPSRARKAPAKASATSKGKTRSHAGR